MAGRIFGAMAETAFAKRKINPETAARYQVFTARAVAETGETVPDPNGNVIAFPYLEKGAEVACKYRGKDKRFWQREGGVRTFWNADVLDDPALSEGRAALVITEGELDALTAIDCGHPFAVSVPDGAPPVPKDKQPEELEPEDIQAEPESKFSFIWRNRHLTKQIKRFVIAVDSDPPGRRLAAELVRRLSAAKCSFVTYPPEAVVPDGEGGMRGCKDLNDVLMYFGRERVIEVINQARPYPVRGLYRLSDYPEARELETYPVGFQGWGLRVFAGEFMVVTGIPSHGKTAFTTNLVANLVTMHGWSAAICSPEMPTVPMFRDALRRYHIGHKPVLSEAEAIAKADRWINERFRFIDTDPTGTGESDEPFNLEWIIERATDAVLRDGIRILVLDPWNEIEHAKRNGETTAEYIARGIRLLKRFARLYGVVVIVVAHPTKEVGIGGKHRLVTLYDIDGAAHWYNKADHGLVVQRADGETTVHVQKVRHEGGTGTKGSLSLTYDASAGRFIPLHGEPRYWAA